MRAMLDLAYSDRAPGMQSGIFKDKDFTNEQAEAMEAFFLESYYYPQMLSFTGAMWLVLGARGRPAPGLP